MALNSLGNPYFAMSIKQVNLPIFHSFSNSKNTILKEGIHFLQFVRLFINDHEVN